MPSLVLQALMAALVIAGLDPQEVELALQGGIPIRADAFKGASGGTAGRGQGAILVWRPVADVFATLSHFDDRTEYIPRVKKVVVLEQRPERVHVWQEIDATVTTARYTAWYELDAAAHVIRWKLDTNAGDNTLKGVEGDYTMIPVDAGRTILIYRAVIDSGLHVPRSIQAYMTKKSLPELLRNIKNRVESGGTWKR
jgi:hypothetical protein